MGDESVSKEEGADVLTRRLRRCVIGAGAVAVLIVLVAALSAEPWSAAKRCEPQPLGTEAYCPNHLTYCAGLVLFCCHNGRILGVCFGAWNNCSQR